MASGLGHRFLYSVIGGAGSLAGLGLCQTGAGCTACYGCVGAGVALTLAALISKARKGADDAA